MSGQGEQACEVVIGQGQLPRSTGQRAAWCRHIIGNPNRKGLRSLRVKKPTKPVKTTARCLPFFRSFSWEGSRPVIIWIIRYTPSILVKEVIDTISKNNFDHCFFCYKKFTKYSQYILLWNYISRWSYLHHFYIFKLNPKEFIYSQSFKCLTWQTPNDFLYWWLVRSCYTWIMVFTLGRKGVKVLYKCFFLASMFSILPKFLKL